MTSQPLLHLSDGSLSNQTDRQVLATALGGARPSPTVLALAATLTSVPLWQRRAWGAEGLRCQLGVPADRALRLAAMWELAERWSPDDRPTVTSPRAAVLLLGGLRAAAREEVWVVLLDARHRPVGCETVAVGSINRSRLVPRDVFGPALRVGAAAVVVAHNHPSGDASPSSADRVVTAALRDAAAIMGVPLLDHVIVTARGHHSFRESDDWESSAA